MEARFCFPKFDGFYVIHDRDHVTGPLTVTMQLAMSHFRGINLTLRPVESYGTMVDKNTESYDGCIGSIQRNESDVTLPGSLTIPVPGPNLTHTVIDGFHKMAILSAYNKTSVSDSDNTHVMDMVFSFPIPLWILLLASYALMFALLVISLVQFAAKNSQKRHHRRVSVWGRERAERYAASRWVLRKKRNPASKSLVVVIACILKQNSSCGCCFVNNAPISIVYTMVTLTAFFSGYFLTSMINTEAVVVRPPITVKTYDEVIEYGRRPTWLNIFTDSSKFKEAAPGTKERRIWETAIAMGLEKSLIGSSVSSVIAHGVAVGNAEEVLLIRNKKYARIIQKAACSFQMTKDIMRTVSSLIRHDPSAMEELSGNIRNPLMRKETADLIDSSIQHTFEGGLSDESVRRFFDIASAFQLTDTEKHFTEIDECSCNVVTVPHAELTAVSLSHYYSLFDLFGLLSLIASVTFLIESLWKRIPKCVNRIHPES